MRQLNVLAAQIQFPSPSGSAASSRTDAMPFNVDGSTPLGSLSHAAGPATRQWATTPRYMPTAARRWAARQRARVVNVANGSAATNAVNVGQLEASRAQTHDYVDVRALSTRDTARHYANTGDAATLASAKAHTGQCTNAVGQDIEQLRQNVDQRFAAQGKRINVVGALGAAMNMAAPDARVKRANQFSMGLGHFRNQRALGVGYSRLISPNVSVRMSAAFADSENAAVAGFNRGC